MNHVLDLKQKLEPRLPQMIGLLERLVNIDSGSYYVPGVNEVGDIMAAHLEKLQFSIERTKVDGRGDFLTATRTLDGQGHLLILGHLDTVWPEGTAEQWPYSEVDEDVATGPGVGDMKGGLVMALHALEVLLEDGYDELASIRFVLVPDEELGSVNTRHLIEREASTADVVLVLEPGRPGGGLVGRRGALGAFFMHAQGCSAHCASNYHKGASAVRELAYKVPELEALSDADNGTVINVGVFQGGTARQVIPGEAKLDIDLRARTDDTAEYLVGAVKQIASKRRDERVRVELKGQLTRPAFTAEHNRELCALALGVAQDLGLEVFEVEPTGGGSDGNFTAAMGIPTLDGLGPVSHDICSRQETMIISSLVERAALFGGIIQRIPSMLSQGN